MGVPRSPTEVCKANLSFEIEGSSSNAEAPPGSRPLEGMRLFKAESAKDQNPATSGKTNRSENCRTRSAWPSPPYGNRHDRPQRFAQPVSILRDSGKGLLRLEASPGSRPTTGRMRNEGESVRPKPSHRYGSGSSGLSQPFGDRQYRPRVV